MSTEQTRDNNASEVVVSVAQLTRNFKRKTALDDVSLEIPKGVVFGLVGENGAGKTTLIRHLLGRLQPNAGSVQVFGLDPVKHPVEVLSRLGYLSEDRNLPGWMQVWELMRYTRAFYPSWDPDYAEELREQFGLDPQAKIKNLSRGELARTGLLIALAYRPELLLLDEPSSGLDPIARRDILEVIVRTVAEEGRTVVFSSHLLEEVDRVADQIGMIHQGKLVFQGELEAIKAQHHHLILSRPGSTEAIRIVVKAFTSLFVVWVMVVSIFAYFYPAYFTWIGPYIQPGLGLDIDLDALEQYTVRQS